METRIYLNRIARELLLQNHQAIVRSIARIVNEGILCPSAVHIQLLLLRVLRRLYALGEGSLDRREEGEGEGVGERRGVGVGVRGPLFLVLRNLALFS